MKINNSFAYKTAKFIERSKITQKFLSAVDKNPSMMESIFSTSLAVILRPATIAVTPTDQDNKRYYISRSIISGFLDLATNAICFLPLQRYLNKKEEQLLKSKNSVYYNNKAVTGSLKSSLNRIGKFGSLPLTAFLLFKLIPITVDRWFPLKKENKNNSKKSLDVKA